jgi:hypothetical protein
MQRHPDDGFGPKTPVELPPNFGLEGFPVSRPLILFDRQ